MASSNTRPAARKPPVVQPASGNNIIVNPTQVHCFSVVIASLSQVSQRLNPILEHVKDVGREFGDIIADYQVGRTTGVIYLR